MEELQPEFPVGDASRVVSLDEIIPVSGTPISTKKLIELFISSTSVTTPILEFIAIMVSSYCWKELTDPWLSGAGCPTERASVSTVQVGTLYRKGRTYYAVAVKASHEGGYDSHLLRYTFPYE